MAVRDLREIFERLLKNMICLLPICKFNIETKLSPQLVKARVSRLLKKETESKKKVEIFFQGQDWGIEEFSGVVTDEYFKLMRYKYSTRDAKFIVYRGDIEAKDNGSIIRLTFRFEIFLMIFLAFIFFIIAVQIFACFMSFNMESFKQTSGILGFFFFTYGCLMIGFNYRVNRVRELFELKLRK